MEQRESMAVATRWEMHWKARWRRLDSTERANELASRVRVDPAAMKKKWKFDLGQTLN